MPIDSIAAIDHLNSVVTEFDLLEHRSNQDTFRLSDTEVTKLLTRLRAALHRLAPPGSVYATALDLAEDYPWVEVCRLAGFAKALHADYCGNFLGTFRELINAELYSDFLMMAEYLIQSENLKQPAAVLAGGVLEEHIRKLCDKHKIATTQPDGKPKKADVMNAELKKANVYSGNDQKQVTAWCGIRNSAAHAKHDEYTGEQVSLMIDGLRSFILRFPA